MREEEEEELERTNFLKRQLVQQCACTHHIILSTHGKRISS